MATNTGDSWIKTLLGDLQQLYTKLSALILNRRMSSYRKESNAHLDKQILSALYDIVEKTPASQVSRDAATVTGSVVQPDGLISAVSDKTRGIKQNNAAPATQHADLSNHLHANLSNSGHLGVKLKASALDHIHASLRYAREGKADLAKMYADLANEALQQASHHLTDEEYIDLKTSILEELRKQRAY